MFPALDCFATGTNAIEPCSNNHEQTNELFELQLLNSLYSTLNTEELIERYFSALKNTFNIQGVSYSNRHFRLQLDFGSTHGNYMSFNLDRKHCELGQIKLFHTDSSTSIAVAHQLEKLALLITHPIKNSLQYLKALTLAHTDPLTGTGSRYSLEETLNREYEAAIRFHQDLSIIMLDIDRFKSINDSLGHGFGDLVLKEVGQIICQAVRGTDMAFRYGGEEFLVILPKTPLCGACITAERLREAIEKQVVHNLTLNAPLTASLGIASYIKGETSRTLLERADQALYAAKNNGRNRVVMTQD